MQRTNQFALYQLGTVLSDLKRLSSETTYDDAWQMVVPARYFFLRHIRSIGIPLPVSDPGISELGKRLQDFGPANTHEEMQKQLGKQVGTGLIGLLKDSLAKFEAIFSAELATLDIYFVPRKGIYSTKDLIEHADEAISELLRNKLTEQARVDFREAGKCLAFDVFTAAGFHALRAVDATLRKYFEKFIGRTPEKGERNWGGALSVLRKAIDPMPNPKTLSMMDRVRDLNRNPVIHPEDNLNGDEALLTFDLCKAAIIAMAMEL